MRLPNQPLAKLAESPAKPKPLITPQRFGKLLRQWRKARGLNQLAVARALSVGRDQAKISKWERGKSLPRKTVLLELLGALS
jgi:predicted transcriptional regulator